MARTLTIRNRDQERAIFAGRVWVVFAMIVLALGILVLRMVQLQVIDHDTYSTRSERNRIETEPIAPTRGLIYDRNGVLLADNVPVFSLTVVRERAGDLDETIAALRGIVAITDEEVAAFRKALDRRRRPFEPVPLKVRLVDEEIARVAVERHRLPGVDVSARLVRHYPFADTFAHAVGSVRRINEADLATLDAVQYSATEYIGRLGVEKVYENQLHGQVGHQRVETDARGRIRQVLEISPPVAGQNITLHLDTRLQLAAIAALGDRRGAIVALEPATGGVLALVSNPGYDPNPFVTGISATDYRVLQQSPDKPLFNRALSGQFPPGSTFKPVVGLAGLAFGVTDWDRIVHDPGYYRLPGSTRMYRDWSWTPDGASGQGDVHLAKAIYRSANVYFYDLAVRLGIDRLAPFAAQFGLGRNIAADIPDAADGLLPSRDWKRAARKSEWYPGDTVNIGIGQGDLLVTPLQLATLAATIANRGRVVRPRMLRSSDRPMPDFDAPREMPRVQGVSPDDFERMVQAMEDVVHRNQGWRENGTAFAYIGRGIGYRMAGKSGTAQVVEIAQGEKYDGDELAERNRKHAWFMAFAPAEAPRIAIAVFVENGGGGSAVAAPVAREVVDAWLDVDGVAQRTPDPSQNVRLAARR